MRDMVFVIALFLVNEYNSIVFKVISNLTYKIGINCCLLPTHIFQILVFYNTHVDTAVIYDLIYINIYLFTALQSNMNII